MKRILLCLLAAAVLFVSVGCSGQTAQKDGQVAFYYKRAHLDYNSAEGVITYEFREPQEHWGDLTNVLNAYLDGPKASELTNVFPEDCDVLMFSVLEDVANVHLSSSFVRLQGVNLTVACVCLTKTVLELTPAKTVRISAEGVTLAGEQYLELDAQSVLLYDDSNARKTP